MSKICSHCGGIINDGEKFCKTCGASTADSINNQDHSSTINSINQNNDPIQNSYNIIQNTNTNSLAIASLVCSIVGILFAGIWLGIISISLSVTASKQLKIYTNQKGKGLATAGLVIGILDIIFATIGVFIN